MGYVSSFSSSAFVALKAFAMHWRDSEIVQREWNDYHVPGYSYFHSVINLCWCVGCFIEVYLSVCVQVIGPGV